MAVNHGFSKGYAFTMSATVGSASVDMQEGFQRCYLQVPTMTSVSALDVYASTDGGTTYYQLRHPPFGDTATVAAPSFIVTHGAAANGALVPIPAGFQFYKIKCTDSNPVGAIAFTILGNT